MGLHRFVPASGNGDYTGITYDPVEDTIWILHNQNRRIQSYTVSATGDFERGDQYFTFQTSTSSIGNVVLPINKLVVLR